MVPNDCVLGFAEHDIADQYNEEAENAQHSSIYMVTCTDDTTIPGDEKIVHLTFVAVSFCTTPMAQCRKMVRIKNHIKHRCEQ